MRVQQRARIHGQAKYRGQWHSARMLGVEQRAPRPKAPSHRCDPSHRLTYLSWNAGGLHTGRHAELKHWLTTPHGLAVDIVATQETHWKGPLEYQTATHVAVHSGGNKSEAGLQIRINRRHYIPERVQHRDIIPGRLLHIRLEGNPCVDLIIGYQHAWTPKGHGTDKQSSKEALLLRRAEYWSQLSAAVSSLPRRNQVLIFADLNTSLEADSVHVGHGLCPRQTENATDAPMLQDLIRSHQLTVLNTWRKAGRSAATFVPAGARGHSQIDFAMARLADLGSIARTASPQSLPFVHFVPTQTFHISLF